MWAYCACAALALVLNPSAFRLLRRAFVLSMLLALPWYAIYPLAPPRFLTGEGFVDTLAVYGPNDFSEGGLVTANRFAAMPSRHVGWTVSAGLMLAAARRRWRLGRVLGTLHVLLIVIAVVVSGNHYWLDIVGGMAVASAAVALARVPPAELAPRWWRRHLGPLDGVGMRARGCPAAAAPVGPRQTHVGAGR